MPARPAVTFDLWHTLVYLEPRGEAAYLAGQYDAAVRVLQDARAEPGAPPVTADQLRAAYDQELRLAVAESHAGRSVTPGEQIARAARALGRVPNPTAFEEALGRLVRATPFQTAPHALETLDAVRRLGMGVGIVSNTVGEPGRFILEMLRPRGFDRSVEVFTFSDEQPWTKPAPEIFLRTLDELGSIPDRAAHIGDGWADLEGARRAGLKGRVLFTGLHAYAPEYRSLNYAPTIDPALIQKEISDLREIVPIVEAWLAGDGAGAP